MMTIQPGEIWLADIPYTDGSGFKIRPVLVLWVDGMDVVVCAVTSAKPRSATDVLLKDWATAGLKVLSTVRLSRIDCLEGSLFRHCLGKISVDDAKEIKETWKLEIHLNF